MDKKTRNKAQPYTTYVFREFDPIMDELHSAALRSGLSNRQIAESGVNPNTMTHWWSRKVKRRTRRPQFATISAVAIATGCTGIKFVDGRPVLIQPHGRQVKLRVVK